jgi:hypothetical protein
MKDDAIDVVCPKCSFEFQLPLGSALTPLMDAEIDRRLNAQRQQIVEQTRAVASKDSDDRNHVAIAMRDKMIADLRLEIDELRRRIDTGSQQLQGEIQELTLEAMLRSAFPRDRIVPVPKGQSGGDAIHEVLGLSGSPVGAILWECKQTKSWSYDWLRKTKQDMRTVAAALCVIATTTMPKGLEVFGHLDGVYVVEFRHVLPLAQILRRVLIEIAAIRATTKQGAAATEKLLAYITGQQFRNRMVSVMEACVALQNDLDADKRATARRWARSQHHIDAVIQSMGGLFGDLQVLLGDSLPELAGVAGTSEPDCGRQAS